MLNASLKSGGEIKAVFCLCFLWTENLKEFVAVDLQWKCHKGQLKNRNLKKEKGYQKVYMNINYKAYNGLKNLICVELRCVPNRIEGSEAV